MIFSNCSLSILSILSFLSSLIILQLILNLFTVKENVLELLVSESLLVSLSMLLYHLQDLAKGHLLADFLHCNTDIVSCYVARVVCIKLLEDGFEL